MILLKGGKHRFKVFQGSNPFDAGTHDLLATIDLDLTNGQEFFTLDFIPQRLRHAFIDYSKDARGLPGWRQIFKGYQVRVGLDYSIIAPADLAAQIGQLMDYQENNDTYYEFYPYINDIDFHFIVLDDTDSLFTRQLEGEGVEGLYLRFISAGVITKLDWHTIAQVAATYKGDPGESITVGQIIT